MSIEVMERIGELRGEIDRARGPARERLLDQLETAVMTLEARGLSAPGWARSTLAARVDAKVEDLFDNMPV